MRDPEGGGRWGNHGFPHPERPGPVRTGARGFEAHCSSPLSYGAKTVARAHRLPGRRPALPAGRPNPGGLCTREKEGARGGTMGSPTT